MRSLEDDSDAVARSGRGFGRSCWKIIRMKLLEADVVDGRVGRRLEGTVIGRVGR